MSAFALLTVTALLSGVWLWHGLDLLILQALPRHRTLEVQELHVNLQV